MTKQEQSQIRNLIQSPQWATLERLAQLVVDKIKDDSTIRETEWETLKATVEQEGEVRGIKRLLQEIMLQGQ